MKVWHISTAQVCGWRNVNCADAYPQNILEPPTDGWRWIFCTQILFLLIIFSLLMTRSARCITSMIQQRLCELRESMILDRVTLKHVKTLRTRTIINESNCYGRGFRSWTKLAVWRGIHWDVRISDVYVRESSAVSDVYSYFLVCIATW